MNIKHFIGTIALASLAMVSIDGTAGNVTAQAARMAANQFVKSQSLKSVKAADINLAHAEASSVAGGANCYYAFNFKEGGFVLISGEDRTPKVLGYSDKGRFDISNLPEGLKDVLGEYKREIEFLQTYTGNDLVPMSQPSLNGAVGVAPLIKATWGQEMPYYLQCPKKSNEYCVVGCVATAMAQVMLYWQYPTSCSSVSSYYCSGLGTLSALPATTFDYSLLLDTYCHWDYSTSSLVQDTYTDAQAQEAAKLSRYCGQAVQMSYDPEGSGAYVPNQLSAMKKFGYSNDAQDVSKSSSWWGWGNDTYTTAEWEAMMKTELNAGRPILYSASDPSAGGHAFICDGYNAEGYFHYNYGWYGTCDGWYLSTSLKMTHRDGDQLNFSSSHEMLIGIEPPAYCNLHAEGLTAQSGLLILGEDMTAQAQNVTLSMSYKNISVLFALTDDNASTLSSSAAVTLAKASFEQGSAVNGSLTLPATLASGQYGLTMSYYTTSASQLTQVASSTGKLRVIGHLAKFDEAFTIADVTQTIDYLLDGSHPVLTIADVTELIDALLTGE